MLVLVSGPRCAGKETVVSHLCALHGFARVSVAASVAPPEPCPASGPASGSSSTSSSSPSSNNSPSNNLSLPPHLAFPDPSAALAFATKNWTRPLVAVLNSIAETDLDDWRKRPFVLLVTVDASTKIRFNRHKASHPNATLEEFVHDDHTLLHQSLQGHASVYTMMHAASLSICNNFDSTQQLFDALDKAHWLHAHRLRPNWDLYFMSLCDLAARRSNCMKRRVGCVVTKDNRVIATGYNGTPKGLRNCNEGGCPRCNDGVAKMGEGIELCICLHAEENALLEAGRERVSGGGGRAVLYCNTCPCVQCARKIIQVGVSEVVYSQSYGMDTVTARLFREAGVVLRQLDCLVTCIS